MLKQKIRSVTPAVTVLVCMAFTFLVSWPTDAQTCYPPPAGLVSWWPGNESTADFQGTNNGTLLNGAGYAPGVVGDGFSFTGADQAVDVGPSANLRLQNFTIEAWIQRYSSTVVSVDTDPNYDGDGVLFGFGLGGYAFILYHDSTLLLSQEGVGGVFSSETITDTSFHHVAVTEDSGTVTFYIDGQVAGVSDNYGPTFSFDTDAFIGAIPTSAGASFYGNIDEMAIYNRPLGSDEIQAIYGAGSAGKCSALTIVDQPTNEVGIVGGTNVFYIQAFGSPPITYKWQFDGAAILNATNPLFVITNVQPTNAGTYSVIVANSNGRLLSSNAVLTVVTPVTILANPTNVPAVLGAPATFSVTAQGTPPLSYQWIFDNQTIAGATNATYTVQDAALTNLGNYQVIVSNPAGPVTSAPAMLALNPEILVNGSAGSDFIFNDEAFANVQIISTFANATIFYTLDGSPPTAASIPYTGPFDLSQSATVTAIAYDQQSDSAVSFPVQIQFNRSCAPPPDGLVSWWPGNNTAIDLTGTNDGVFLAGPSYDPGEVAQAFFLTNAAQAIDVGYATNLQLQNFTIEAWVRRANSSAVTLDPNPNDQYNGCIFGYGGGGYALAIYNDNRLLLTQVGSSGTWSVGTITDTQYHHVAVTKTNDAVVFYIDGVQAGSNSYNPSFFFNTHAYIGGISYGGVADSFYGSIDELAVYDRALGSNEIQQICGAREAGKCTPLAIVAQPTNELGFAGQSVAFSVGAVGSGPLSYQWFFNSNIIAAATNSVLTLTNLQAASAGSYSVIVSNAASTAQSSNSVLSVVDAVAIQSGPSNVAAVLGSPVTFSVSASGTPPLSYQWAHNGTNIAGATNSTYTIHSVGFLSLGSYTVSISNLWSAVTSAPGLLLFNPQITVNGNAGTNFAFTNIHSVSIQMSSPFSGETIFYTLDGSTPSFASTPYQGPFALGQSAVIQAVAYDSDFNPSYSLTVDVSLVISNTLTISTPGGGSVSVTPPGGLYVNSQTVQATATPSNGWTFLYWTGTVSGTNPVLSIPMTTNQNVQAVFGSSIALAHPQNGTLQIRPNLPFYPYGSVAQVSALPAPGYYFALWGGSASGAVNPYFMTVTNPNPTVSALFAQLAAGNFSLVLIPNGNGRVSVAPPGNSFVSNSVVTISATPLGTNHFYYWTGDTNSPTTPLHITMRSSKVITANFTGGAYPLEFISPRATPTSFTATLTGFPLAAYDVDVSTNLIDWSLFATVTNKTGSVPLVDSGSNGPEKFYRALPH